MGWVIKENVMRDYFQVYEMGKGNHYQQWMPLPNTALKGKEKS